MLQSTFQGQIKEHAYVKHVQTYLQYMYEYYS